MAVLCPSAAERVSQAIDIVEQRNSATSTASSRCLDVSLASIARLANVYTSTIWRQPLLHERIKELKEQADPRDVVISRAIAKLTADGWPVHIEIYDIARESGLKPIVVWRRRVANTKLSAEIADATKWMCSDVQILTVLADRLGVLKIDVQRKRQLRLAHQSASPALLGENFVCSWKENKPEHTGIWADFFEACWGKAYKKIRPSVIARAAGYQFQRLWQRCERHQADLKPLINGVRPRKNSSTLGVMTRS